MTRAQVIKKLNEKRGHKSVLAFSKEIGVSQQLLDRVLKGQQAPTPVILDVLGLGLKRFVTKKETFLPVGSGQSNLQGASATATSTHGSK